MARIGRILGAITGATVGFLAGGPIGAVAGGIAGGASGSEQDESRRANRASRAYLDEQKRNAEQERARLATEKTATDERIRMERERINAGIARSNRRRYRAGGSFLESTNPVQASGVLG